MTIVNWLVVALVILLTCGITGAALVAITRYCRRFPDLTEDVVDEEFP